MQEKERGVNFGRVSEWLMEARCKRVGTAYGGSNPSSPTKFSGIA